MLGRRSTGKGETQRGVLRIADVVGLGVHTGQTSTHGGTNLGYFLRIWWAPGNTGPGLATGRTKHHNLTVSADQFGGRR